MAPALTNTKPPAWARDEQALTEVVDRAMKGDASTLPVVQALLDGPLRDAMLEAYGNVAAAAERAFVSAFAGDNLVVQEAVRHKLAAVRAELAGPGPSPLERLLVERVALCWLQVYHADSCSARARVCDLARRDFCDRQQSKAQARYLAAVKALVTVRKLLRPPVSPMDLAARPVNEAPAAPRSRRSGPTRTVSEGVVN